MILAVGSANNNTDDGRKEYKKNQYTISNNNKLVHIVRE